MFGYGYNSHNNKDEGKTTSNQSVGVFTTCTSGVWKLDDSKCKVDTNHPKVDLVSICM